MYQVDEATAAATLPTPAAPGTAGFFTNGNPGTGVAPTIVDADILNAMMLELINIVQGGGVTLSKTAQNQAIKALRRLFAGNVTTLAANTALTTDNAGLVNLNGAAGSITITLPAAAVVAGFPIYYDFVRTDTTSANTVTITAGGTDTIDGLASITLPISSYRGIVCDGVGIWRSVSATPAAAVQCALSVTSATVVTLGPSANGNKVFHPTAGWLTIPAAGITATSTGCYVNGSLGSLGANTNYWVYLFVNAGVLTLDFCTGQSSGTRDASTGLPIKSGDNSRLLVAGVRTNASSQFFNGSGLCGISNFWNRRKLFIAPGSATSSTTNTSATSTAATNGCWVWSDEPVSYRVTSSAWNTTGGDGVTVQPGIDGAVVPSSTTWVSPAGSAAAAVIGASFTQPAEGYHTFTAFANAITGGTANYQISQTIEVNG